MILATDPNDSGREVWFYTHAETLRQYADRGQRGMLGDYLGLIKGAKGFEAVRSAVACFQGTKRPHKRDGYDDKIFIYISTPPFQCRLTDSGPPELLEVNPSPVEMVFAVYAILRSDGPIEFHQGFDEEHRDLVMGEILGWEWLDGSEDEPSLPRGWKQRYKRRAWI